jgi:hypothetical protein
MCRGRGVVVWGREGGGGETAWPWPSGAFPPSAVTTPLAHSDSSRVASSKPPPLCGTSSTDCKVSWNLEGTNCAMALWPSSTRGLRGRVLRELSRHVGALGSTGADGGFERGSGRQRLPRLARRLASAAAASAAGTAGAARSAGATGATPSPCTAAAAAAAIRVGSAVAGTASAPVLRVQLVHAAWCGRRLGWRWRWWCSDAGARVGECSPATTPAATTRPQRRWWRRPPETPEGSASPSRGRPCGAREAPTRARGAARGGEGEGEGAGEEGQGAQAEARGGGSAATEAARLDPDVEQRDGRQAA